MVTLPKYVSKIDYVTNTLRTLISDGQYRPGTALRQRELAERIGVSVTPVREALRRLESEGMVSFDPHAGATVVQVDFGPTEENFRIRAALEPLAAEMATQHIDDAAIEELQKIVDSIKEAAESDPAALSELNRDFHFGIYDHSDAPLLVLLIRRLWLSFGAGPVLRHNPEQSLRQHDEIMDALRARDPEWAKRAIREHILTGMQRAGLREPDRATSGASDK